MSLVIVEAPSRRVACFRHVGSYPEIGRTFEKLDAWMTANHVAVNTKLAIYHDDPSQVEAAHLRSDACLVVDPATKAEGDVTVETLPGGKYAVHTYIGSYAGLPNAWNEAHSEMVSQGLEWDLRPAYELYVGDHSSMIPEEMKTEIYIPVR